MKKIIFIFVCVFATSNIFAQSDAFKINPAAFFYSGFEIGYETVAYEKDTAELIFGYSNIKIDDSDIGLQTYAGEIRYKFNISKEKIPFKGFYLAPALTYGEGTRKNTFQSPDKISFFGIGFLVGHQFKIKTNATSAFLIDLNVGVSNFITKSTPLLNDEKVKGIRPRAGISFGYAF